MNLNKINIQIAGFPKCKDYNYVCYIAENLRDQLPNFSVKKITKKYCDWKDWLEEMCKKHEWSHNESPLILRETELCGSSPVYIGGVSEFKIFIHDYYGIDLILSETEAECLKLDYSLAQDIELEDKSYDLDPNILHITISGAGSSVVLYLVAQLAVMKGISQNGIVINLYDIPDNFLKIEDVIRDASAIDDTQLCSIKNLKHLSDGLKRCDLLIMLDYVTRKDEYESSWKWLRSNYEAVKQVAEQIEIYGSSNMKVIFCSMGPACFQANVLLKETTKLDKNNVVVVSAHYGLEWIYGLIKSESINCKNIGCPPVWGFLGINHYVDIHHTVQKSSVLIPSKRALTSRSNSTLPSGVTYTELNWLLYLSFNKKPHEILYNQEVSDTYEVEQNKNFHKCKAICDLLRFWYEKDNAKVGDEIITLGILSDGTFNITKGLYFSQPVHLKILDDNSRVWVPCAEFPLPSNHLTMLMNFVETAEILLKKFDCH